MKQPPLPGWIAVRVEYPVGIPNIEGTGFSATIPIMVDAWKNAEGEIFLGGESRDQIEKTRARHMGLLSPEEIKAMREQLGLTQKQISTLLQIGAKTWTRWESGKERPSRVLNLLLCAIRDGRVDVPYLRQRQQSQRQHKTIPDHPVMTAK